MGQKQGRYRDTKREDTFKAMQPLGTRMVSTRLAEILKISRKSASMTLAAMWDSSVKGVSALDTPKVRREAIRNPKEGQSRWTYYLEAREEDKSHHPERWHDHAIMDVLSAMDYMVRSGACFIQDEAVA